MTTSRLTLIGESTRKYYSVYTCTCGNIKTIRTCDVNAGRSKSCGCVTREKASLRAIERNTRHGKFGTKVYAVWDSMLARCLNVKNVNYKHYGARGITVCKRWFTFENFYADMGEPNGLTLERRNTNKGYSKANCHWATMREQQNNRRNNVRLIFNGKSQTIAQWSDELGISRPKIYQRNYSGWTIERMLTTP